MTARPDIDATYAHMPRRGSLDLTRLLARGTLYRFTTRGDLIHASRARDARMIAGGFLAGCIASAAVLVLAVSWGVISKGGAP